MLNSGKAQRRIAILSSNSAFHIPHSELNEYGIPNTYIITRYRFRRLDSGGKLACQWSYQRGHPRQVVAAHHRLDHCGLRHLVA